MEHPSSPGTGLHPAPCAHGGIGQGVVVASAVVVKGVVVAKIYITRKQTCTIIEEASFGNRLTLEHQRQRQTKRIAEKKDENGFLFL